MNLLSYKITPLLFVLFFAVNICLPQSSTITINSKTKLKKIKPGKHYTILFEVLNPSNKPIKLNFVYNLPNQFKPILASKTKTIAASGKKNIIFSFSVDKYCKAENFNIEIIANIEEKPVANFKINLEVDKIFNLDITPLESPKYLRFEKDFTCKYTVTNKGNSAENIQLESSRSISVKPTHITLSPDSSAVVTVVQAVPFTPFSKTLALNVLSAQVASSGIKFSNRTPITVYPNSTKKPDLYHRYPISIATVFNYLNGDETINAFKYNVSGSGFLDRKHNHYLNFSYSGPNQPKLVRFGEYDQYNILYKSKKLEVNAGDVSYTLSNISEASRNGRGSIITYNFAKSNASVFFLEPRFTDRISGIFGGDIQWSLSEKSLIKFGLINRTILENDISLKSQIYSLSSTYAAKYFKVTGEVAFENNDLTNGFGLSFDSFYNKRKLQWVNSIQYSDKDFKGYLRNSKSFTTLINYQLLNKINLHSSGIYRSINPERDEINYNSSPIIENYKVGINYKLNRTNGLKLGASYRKKEDRLEPKKFHFKENLISIFYSKLKMNNYSLQLSNSYGTTQNLLIENADETTAFYSTADISYSIFKNLNISLSANYEYTSRNSTTNNIQSSIYYGGNIQYQLKNKLNLSLFYRNDYAIDELEADAQSFLEAQIQYNYNNNHRFSFSASQASLPSQTSTKNKELFLSASYNLIINTPLSKDKTKGSLKGKIISKDNENLEGILISLESKAAVTNKKGEFIFYNLVPNQYSLTVAQSSLPKNKIIVERTPLKINIAPNKESYIELNVGKTGSLNGVINLKEIKSTRSSKFEKKLPRVVVKISNKDTKFLTQTNAKGQFTFNKLVPGEWRVELIIKSLAKDFTFTKPIKNIIIKPDETTNVEFNAATKNRRLKKSKKTFKL
ncbi:hypothetical protein SAMN05444411_101597 [Lutibacter oricola]|uniref:Carboxypeptidase regulatory-like domain-containing protein n=1 Tax=Lutibacter oricola TaxID=762486 RepID=A0A1H2T1E2_9FLAO|nr:hypothetical protein [Lutibacter oricola]SDW37607.1 hypothetical protein SAMN05444411_101597 [Lutibacter oricola]